MVHPKGEILLRKVGHYVDDLAKGEVAHGAHFFECFQHEVAKFARSGPQLDDVQGFVVVQFDGRVGTTAVADEPVQHLHNEGIKG